MASAQGTRTGHPQPLRCEHTPRQREAAATSEVHLGPGHRALAARALRPHKKEPEMQPAMESTQDKRTGHLQLPPWERAHPRASATCSHSCSQLSTRSQATCSPLAANTDLRSPEHRQRAAPALQTHSNAHQQLLLAQPLLCTSLLSLSSTHSSFSLADEADRLATLRAIGSIWS